LASSALTLLLSSCGLRQNLFDGNAKGLGEPAPQRGVVGFAVTPVPEATLAAQQILSEGGNAADAATAAGFALAVTLPSRAGLGSGGACLIRMKGHKGPIVTTALMFLPEPGTGGGSRPAAVPMLARGLVAMQARYGRLSLAADLAPAETMAGGGVPVSQALAADLSVVGNAFLADPAARAIFAGPDGRILREGETLQQPDLANVLNRLQANGVLDFYQGRLAARITRAADQAGGGLTAVNFQDAKPFYATPIMLNHFGAQIALLPRPASGGVGAAAGIEALAQNPRNLTMAAMQARDRAMVVRDGGVAADGTALPASAGFAVLDHQGGAVGCVTSMDNLFGTGRIAPGTGIVLAASPARIKPPLLTAGLASQGAKFRAIAVSSGQQGAPMAVADGLYNALHTPIAMPQTVPGPGRVSVIACAGGLPGAPKSCTAAADPRSFGLAVGNR
jgi:gamma-glutamyltranspeptidase/glutathione hydrolase